MMSKRLTTKQRIGRAELKVFNIKNQIEFLQSCLRGWEKELEKLRAKEKPQRRGDE
jgi:hypothetical protein